MAKDYVLQLATDGNRAASEIQKHLKGLSAAGGMELGKVIDLGRLDGKQFLTAGVSIQSGMKPRSMSKLKRALQEKAERFGFALVNFVPA